MSLSYRTLEEIPYLRSYKAASAHEKAVAPIRGHVPPVKPLGRRNQKHHSIMRDADTGIIHIIRGWLRANPSRDEIWLNTLIAYRPDGIIHLVPPTGQCKASEKELISEVTGWDLVSKHDALWVHTHNRGYVRLYRDPQMNQFRFTDDMRDRCEGVVTQPTITRMLDRKAMARVRAPYADYLAYHSGMTKLRRDNPPNHDEYRNALPKDDKGANIWLRLPGMWSYSPRDLNFVLDLMRSERPEDNHRAWLLIIRSGTTALDKLIIAKHADEVLIDKVHSDGKIRKDAYNWLSKAQLT